VKQFSGTGFWGEGIQYVPEGVWVIRALTVLYAFSCNEHHTIYFGTIEHLCIHSIAFLVLPDRFYSILYKCVT